jgi:hypothetical protein
MHDRQLAAAGGAAPSRKARAGAFLVLAVLAFFTVMVAQTQDQAYALAVPPPTATLPVGITGAGAATAAGETVAVGATTAEVAAGGTVCAATVVCLAGVLLVGTAVWIGWHWASGHNSNMYDPATSGFPNTTYTGGWALSASSCPSYYCTTSMTVGTLTGASQVKMQMLTTNSSGGYQGAADTCINSCSPTSPGVALTNVASNTTTGTATGSCIAAQNASSGGTWYIVAKIGSPDYAACNAAGLSGGAPTVQSGGTTTPTGTNVVTVTPTSQCSGGGSVAGTAVTFTGATATGSLPPMGLPACPAGQTRTGATFPTAAPGVTTPTQPLTNWTAPTIPSGFPECNVVGKACQLNLFRVGHGTGATQQSCDASGDCAQWQTQTQRTGAKRTVKTLVGGVYAGVTKSPGDDVQENSRVWPNGDTAECFWGPYEVEVDGCGTVPTDPAPSATAGTANETKSDGDGGSCFPTGWAIFNPVEWVYKPVKCALVWAFVPPQSAIDAAQGRLQTAWNATALGTVSTAIGSIYAPITALSTASAGSCDGPSFVIPQLPTMPHSITLHPLSTCPPLVAYILGIYMPIATAAIYIGGFFAGTRRILKAFGADGPDGDDT